MPDRYTLEVVESVFVQESSESEDHSTTVSADGETEDRTSVWSMEVSES